MKYLVSYSKRKTISLRIIDENTVKISAPNSANREVIEKFVLSKKSWIQKKISLLNKLNNKFDDVINGNKICLFGEIINFSGNKSKYLNEIAEEYLPKRIKELSILYNLKYNGLKLKNYKSKWGQCDKQRNITLNKKLIFLNREVIDYIILHELCHTLYMNHQKNFHKKLSSLVNNEAQLIKQLKEYSILIKYKL